MPAILLRYPPTVPTINVSNIYIYDALKVERMEEKDEIILEFPADILNLVFQVAQYSLKGDPLLALLLKCFLKRVIAKFMGEPHPSRT